MNWQWIASLALIGIASSLLVCQYVYVLFFHKIERDGSYTLAPFLLGLMIFVGVILLPVELPINRWLFASIAMCIDITIPMFPFALLYMSSKGDFKRK